MVAIDDDLTDVEAQDATAQGEVTDKANAILRTFSKVISDVDMEAAAARVEKLRQEHPEASLEELSKRLIREKCEHTGKVGAVTSGAALIPGIGSAAALTLGVAADIGASFKLHAELVLELAALHDYPLTDEEKQRLVLAITGNIGIPVLINGKGVDMRIRIAANTIKADVSFLSPEN